LLSPLSALSSPSPLPLRKPYINDKSIDTFIGIIITSLSHLNQATKLQKLGCIVNYTHLQEGQHYVSAISTIGCHYSFLQYKNMCIEYWGKNEK
jgi:hypothetical protein